MNEGGVISGKAVFCTICAGLLIVVFYFSGYFTGSIATRREFERVVAERDAEYERYRTTVDEFRKSVELDRKRVTVLGDAIYTAVERAGGIKNSADRIIVLTGALRTVADGIRSIYEQSTAVLPDTGGEGPEDYQESEDGHSNR
jgi:hypothetical protein